MSLLAEVDWEKTVTAVGGVLSIILLIVNRVMDWLDKRELKKEIVIGNDLTKAVMPAVAEKVDSATYEVRQAQDRIQETQQRATQVADIAATKVGTLFAKTLSDKADATAVKVAEVAREASENLVNRVETLAKTIKGDDGTCVVGKLTEHGRVLEEQGSRLTAVEQDVKSLKSTAEATLEIVRNLKPPTPVRGETLPPDQRRIG